MIMTLPIGGIVPFSAIDYPGCFSLVVFCQGCPWRCHYCHNPHLQPFVRKRASKKSGLWQDALALLKRRRGLLDAVVFSGGEPTAHAGLLPAIREVKELGFKIGLHTAGCYPDRLLQLIGYLDWVGLDIKAPFDAYEKITDRPQSGDKAKKSAEMILKSGVSYEFRTTVHPALLFSSDLDNVKLALREMGVKNHVLQEFRKEGCQNQKLCR